MRYLRATLIAVALAVVSIGFGAASAVDKSSGEPQQSAAFCQRCGDGYCARSCENAQTCPADCGGGSGGTTKAH
jgi:hypothetical protein